MTLTEITYSALFVFLPGIVGVLLINLLTSSKIYEAKVFFLYSYIISLISYSIIGLFMKQGFIKFLASDGEFKILPKEILLSTGVSIFLSAIVVLVINYKLAFTGAMKMKLSNKYGSGDVWFDVFNDEKTKWITLRPQNSIQYFIGQVEQFSDDGEIRELYLHDVAIYDADTEKYLYSQAKMYFSFPIDTELTIEIGEFKIDERRKGVSENE